MKLSDFRFNSCYKNEVLNECLCSEIGNLLKKYSFPGITCAYLLPDGTGGEVAIGLADKELKKTMTTNSRMLAASIGKTFVAAIVIALANEDRLNFDDPVALYLGKFDWYCHLPNHSTIMIRHLLTHSSGLPDHVYTKNCLQLFLQRSSIIEPKELLAGILDKTPLFQVGQGWAYTDSGYILLGLVIEVITGKTYYTELMERFLLPLQLSNTKPSDRPLLQGLIPGYTSLNNPFGLPSKVVDDFGMLVFNPAIEWTGGGLISISRDLVVWAKLLYEEHAMPCKYIDILLQAVSINSEGIDSQYGAGVVIIPQTSFGEQLGHRGIIPGYASSMQYYRQYKIAIAFQVNTDENAISMINDIEQSLARIIIQ